MKAVQPNENWLDSIGALIKTAYYFLYLPCALFFALLTSFVLLGGSDNTLYATDYFLLSFMWLSIIIPLGIRWLNISKRRQQLEKMVTLLTSNERFTPQKQHQILDAGGGKYLGIDTKLGTILYIHIAKKGVVNVSGLTMRDWTDRELEGSALRLYTKNADLPVLTVNAHPVVAKEMFNVLGAMNSTTFPERFPLEPWPEYVGRQSRFVEFEHNVVVPQAV